MHPDGYKQYNYIYVQIFRCHLFQQLKQVISPKYRLYSGQCESMDPTIKYPVTIVTSLITTRDIASKLLNQSTVAICCNG